MDTGLTEERSFVKLARTTNLAQRQTQCWCKTLCVLTNLAQRQTK